MFRSAFISIVTLLAVSLPATAQPLADRVPADAIIYVGWAGAESMGPGFEASHLKALLDSGEVGRIVDEVLPRALERFAENEPVEAQQVRMITTMLTPLWRHPTALYVGPVDMANPGQPMPRVALICDAGEEAASLQQKLQQLVKQQGQNVPFPIAVRKTGNVVALVAGKAPELDAVLAGKGKGKTIRSVKSLATVMAAQKSPALAGYVNAEAVIRFADKMVAQQADPDVKENWPAARDALGLAGLKRMSFAAGFDGKDWGTHAFIEAPAPRKGLLAMLEAEPVSDDALRAIPSTATMAGVARIDLGKTFDALRAAIAKFDEAAGAQVDEGLKQVNAMLTLDVRQDVLEPLGDEWAYYIAPEVTGRGPLGIVAVNRLGDAAKAQAASDKLQELANAMIGQQLPPDMKVSFKQAKVGDVTVQYLATPFVTPSWAIQNGNLYLGFYPQLVAGAAGHVSREGKSILDNEKFVALRKRLGNQKATAFQFYDLPATAPTNYQTWMMVASFGKFGDLFGVDTPPMLLPPLQTLMEHVSVAGAVSWTDDQGWHYRGVTPFPGGTLVAGETGGTMDVQTAVMLPAILLPSLNRAREQANRIKSATNLRQIGLGLQMYANEHKGRYPDDLAAAQEFIGTAETYANPRSPSAPVPPGLEGEALKAWINESSDYAYLGKGKSVRERGDVVLAHEKPDGLTDGLNILFNDGHVEFQAMPQAMQTIKQAGPGGREQGVEQRGVGEPVPGDGL